MNYCSLTYAFFLILATVPMQSSADISFKGITNWINGYKEETFYKEEPLESNKTVSVSTPRGSIHIKSWSLPKIAIKGIKTALEKDLDAITIETTINADGSINIQGKPEEAADGTVDFELIVPRNTILQLSTGEGLIKVKKIDKAITAKTDDGAIEVYEASSNLNLLATKNITASFNIVPLNCSALLETIQGSISLHLPEDTNADIDAKTNQGTVTSELYITLRPRTVKLNTNTWNLFKREATGKIGNGGATIKASTDSGNIKILEY